MADFPEKDLSTFALVMVPVGELRFRIVDFDSELAYLGVKSWNADSRRE